jgi:hypothetical protein
VIFDDGEGRPPGLDRSSGQPYSPAFRIVLLL